MRRIMLISLLSYSTVAYAQNGRDDSTKTKNLTNVLVTGYKNTYKIDSSISVAKLPLKDIENPQVYNSISKNVIKDQVLTNINQTLKNATGITRLWESTGRGGDGAEYYTMRGFSVQPTMLNDMPNISNGTPDIANIEQVEVIKGPSGTLFGGNIISYGGLVNIVTKKPYEQFGGEVGYIIGSYGLNRLTADVNTPLSKTVFSRINAAFQSENSFQNAGSHKSFCIAPNFKIVASKKLSFWVNTEFKSSESANAPMIFLNRYAKLSLNSIDIFKKNYKNAYTTNSLSIKKPTYSVQTYMTYKINNDWQLHSAISRSNTTTNGYYHYLWDLSDGNHFARYISKRNGNTVTTDLQQNLNGKFTLGKISNNLVIGIDYLNSQITNNSTGWVANGKVSLVSQTDSGKLTTQAVDNFLVNSSEGNTMVETKTTSAYVSDVISFSKKLSLMLSLRLQNFKGTPLWSTQAIKSQTNFSPKLGIVYQPVPDKLTVFANYMNGFTNLAPVEVSDVNGNNPTIKILEPEQANQWEVGLKSNVYKDKIAFTASYYQIKVTNKTMSDPANVNNIIQGGAVSSKGFELSIVTSPIDGLSIIGGFSKNKSIVTKDAADGGYLGLRPEEAGPETLVNFWANYKVQQGKFQGLGFGLGANYASAFQTLNRSTTGSFTLPAYTIYNAAISYTTTQYSINVKLDNIANTEYFTGWSTVTPQKLRAISIGLSFKF